MCLGRHDSCGELQIWSLSTLTPSRSSAPSSLLVANYGPIICPNCTRDELAANDVNGTRSVWCHGAVTNGSCPCQPPQSVLRLPRRLTCIKDSSTPVRALLMKSSTVSEYRLLTRDASRRSCRSVVLVRSQTTCPRSWTSFFIDVWWSAPLEETYGYTNIAMSWWVLLDVGRLLSLTSPRALTRTVDNFTCPWTIWCRPMTR